MQQDKAPKTYGQAGTDTYQPVPDAPAARTRLLPDRRTQLASRDAQVRKILGLSPTAPVTDQTVRRAICVQRRRETKAIQSMDYRTMLAHFQERAEASKQGQQPVPAPRRERRAMLHKALRIAYRNGRLSEPTATA